MIFALEWLAAVAVGTACGSLPVKVVYDRRCRRDFDDAVAHPPTGADPAQWRASMLAIYDPKGRRKLARR